MDKHASELRLQGQAAWFTVNTSEGEVQSAGVGMQLSAPLKRVVVGRGWRMVFASRL